MAQPSSADGRIVRNWLWALIAPIVIGGLVTGYILYDISRCRRCEQVNRHIAEVKTGMTEAEVLALIGEPDRVKTGQADIIDTAVASTVRIQPARDKTVWEYRYANDIDTRGRSRWKNTSISFKDGKVTFNSFGLGF